MNLYMNSCIWIHFQTLLGSSSWYPLNHMFFYEFIYEFMYEFINEFIHKWMYDIPWMHIWIDGINLYTNPSWYPAIHVFHVKFTNSIQISWILAIFHWTDHIWDHFWRTSWKISWFHGSFKRNLNWVHGRCALTCSVWWGQPILRLLLQSHLPHYQLVCLLELQCKYLPPWSYHTFSSGCQSCTNWNFVVILVQTLSLATAGCAWQVKVQSSNFSPGTRPSWSPTYGPEWVTIHEFSSAFQVNRFQAEWLWSIASLKSLMQWNRPTGTGDYFKFKLTDSKKIVFGCV